MNNIFKASQPRGLKVSRASTGRVGRCHQALNGQREAAGE